MTTIYKQRAILYSNVAIQKRKARKPNNNISS